jgi:hypothetical protein
MLQYLEATMPTSNFSDISDFRTTSLRYSLGTGRPGVLIEPLSTALPHTQRFGLGLGSDAGQQLPRTVWT